MLLQQASVYSELLSQHASFVFHILVVSDVRDNMSNGAADMHKVRSTIGPFYCKVCMCAPAVTMINFSSQSTVTRILTVSETSK
jgi:hypothetical protein